MALRERRGGNQTSQNSAPSRRLVRAEVIRCFKRLVRRAEHSWEHCRACKPISRSARATLRSQCATRRQQGLSPRRRGTGDPDDRTGKRSQTKSRLCPDNAVLSWTAWRGGVPARRYRQVADSDRWHLGAAQGWPIALILFAVFRPNDQHREILD